jgi:hypothetical protein
MAKEAMSQCVAIPAGLLVTTEAKPLWQQLAMPFTWLLYLVLLNQLQNTAVLIAVRLLLVMTIVITPSH